MSATHQQTGTGPSTRLAIDGGTPVRAVPIDVAARLSDADVATAVRVLRSANLGGPDHPEVRRFETLLAASCRVDHAVAVNSGTAALHCILRALGVGPGDEVIVPAHTFVATATPVLMVGATPVIVDVTEDTYCIDPSAVAAAVSTRTRAIVAVHLNGHPAAVNALPEGIAVISDACQAHGAILDGRPVAGLGVAGAYSFWQDKLITAGGEGGAVLTSDAAIAASTALSRSHAQVPIAGTANAHHVSLGYNYRLTGVQAAVGASQLGRLPDMVRVRRASARQLVDRLADVPGIGVPVTRPGVVHVFWKFVVRLDTDRFRVDRDAIVRALRAEGIAAAPRYPVPLHRQPVLTGSSRLTPCPVSDYLADRLVTLGLPVSGDDRDVQDTADAVAKVLDAVRR